MKNKKRIITDFIMLFILFLGIGVIAYPFVSDALSNMIDQQMISHYQKQANKENEVAMKKRLASMEKKNKSLAKEGGNPGADPFEGNDKSSQAISSDLFKKHTIGVIHIPKIHVKLPIFDETNDIFLSQGITLLGGTSYPTGGKSTHTVLSGHRGLAKAKFFSDLPDLEKKDHFYLEVNQEIHAYEVDQIKVVTPDNAEDLHIEEGKDLVTLLTCTPYMVNSHRLLVRGHRIPYVPEMKKELAKSSQANLWKNSAILAGSILGLLLLIGLIIRYLRGLLLKKRHYDFVLKDTFHEGAVMYLLKDKKGKEVLAKQALNLKQTVSFTGLKGQQYRLVSEDNKVNLTLKVKKMKSTSLVGKLVKSKNTTMVLTKEETYYHLEKRN